TADPAVELGNIADRDPVVEPREPQECGPGDFAVLKLISDFVHAKRADGLLIHAKKKALFRNLNYVTQSSSRPLILSRDTADLQSVVVSINNCRSPASPKRRDRSL